MNTKTRFFKIIIIVIVSAILSIFGCSLISKESKPSNIVAFSLKNASSSIIDDSQQEAVKFFAGITRIGGFIIDDKEKDIILVGLIDKELPGAKFDDFVTALRSRVLYDEFPLVSIDPDKNSYQTRQQKVRFDGHLEDTHFGKVFLQCDILLKKYCLNLVESISEVPTYNAFFEKDIIAGINRDGYSVKNFSWHVSEKSGLNLADYSGLKQIEHDEYQARFWFYPMQPISYIHRDDVFLIRDLNIGLEAEEVYSKINTNMQARKKFAETFTANYDLLCKKHKELKYLKLLYDFTALSNSLKIVLESNPQFNFINALLKEYQIQKVPTPNVYGLQEIFGKAELNNGMINLISVSGGIKFGDEIRMLNYGDFGKLKKIVLQTRPSESSLYWHLPVQGWVMPNARELTSIKTVKKERQDDFGCYVRVQSIPINPTALPQTGSDAFSGFSTQQKDLPPLKGVSMKMKLDNSSFIEGGKALEKLRDQILNESEG